MLGESLIAIGTIGLIFSAITKEVREIDLYVINRDLIKYTVDQLIPNNDAVIYYLDTKDSLDDALKSFKGHLTSTEIKEVEQRYWDKRCYGCSFEGSNLAVIFLNEIKNSNKDISKVGNFLYEVVLHEINHIIFDTPDEKLVRDLTSKIMESNVFPFPFMKDSSKSLFKINFL